MEKKNKNKNKKTKNKQHYFFLFQYKKILRKKVCVSQIIVHNGR